jgi:hypothetical protein
VLVLVLVGRGTIKACPMVKRRRNPRVLLVPNIFIVCVSVGLRTAALYGIVTNVHNGSRKMDRVDGL